MPDPYARTVAVLGPTNTGKTHYAIERMLGYGSGMIGFPLRLLARENYDRIVRLRGARSVALVTGEERIIPPRPAYWVCTVESMPVDLAVDFLAVDEIQLAADMERGHLFTHRLLHARGLFETLFLGAETMAPLLRRLVPGIEFLPRVRFSRLTYAGTCKLTRLPRRSAVVAFSAGEVYAMAELLRRQRGGTAVVLGALSPRTRNAQVGMYQAGEVDYLVATDAIGMGLNMDIDHVALAALSKFDGRMPRRLTAPELAQIAGRAGRHMADGTFGTTAEVGALEPELVEALETHEFPPLRALRWRNPDLDFRSVRGLLRSLEAKPPSRLLMRGRDADDYLTLAALARDEAVAAAHPAAVRLLWEVCQVPDFRKVLSDAHTRLVGQLFRFLTTPEGRLPTDWVARQVARIDRVDGDIDTLSARIAHIRTWTYISHRPHWLEDAAHWQEQARAIEDRLSDALHDRLTQRFVDRRASMLTRRLREGGSLMAAVTRSGEVLVEGEPVGRFAGFAFAEDLGDGSDVTDRAVIGAANRAVREAVAARVRRFAEEPDAAVTLDSAGMLHWDGAAIARLARGRDPVAPAIELLPSELLGPELREAVRRRLAKWLDRHLARRLGALRRLLAAPLSGPARGLAWRLAEGYGSLLRSEPQGQIAALSGPDRMALRRHGVRLGSRHVFLPALLKPDAVALRGVLWAVQTGGGPVPGEPVPAGRVSVPCDPGIDPDVYRAIGYEPVPLQAGGARAVRVDMLDRLADALADLARSGPFPLPVTLGPLVGCGAEDLPDLLRLLGYSARPDPSGATGAARYAPSERRRPARRVRAPAHNPASPFAKLRHLPAASS